MLCENDMLCELIDSKPDANAEELHELYTILENELPQKCTVLVRIHCTRYSMNRSEYFAFEHVTISEVMKAFMQKYSYYRQAEVTTDSSGDLRLIVTLPNGDDWITFRVATDDDELYDYMLLMHNIGDDEIANRIAFKMLPTLCSKTATNMVYDDSIPRNVYDAVKNIIE